MALDWSLETGRPRPEICTRPSSMPAPMSFESRSCESIAEASCEQRGQRRGPGQICDVVKTASLCSTTEWFRTLT